MVDEEYIDDREVARILGKSVVTVRNWRCKGYDYGPRFFKIGHSVRYRRSDVHNWLESCVVDPAARNDGRAA
ncbi:MAG: helix-turn-helix domain-containing protein [Pseudomonadota bacterium]|nr:helix-turn-helix domain-containing protein [Pseudomonadota bacterium]